jgi:hypothetical protein
MSTPAEISAVRSQSRSSLLRIGDLFEVDENDETGIA